MNLIEFVQKNQKSIHKIFECKNIDEFKKFINKNHIDHADEEDLKKAWDQVASKKNEIDDDALAAVAGGQSLVDVTTGSTEDTTKVNQNVKVKFKSKGKMNLNLNMTNLMNLTFGNTPTGQSMSSSQTSTSIL